jgi:hypothetical protein
MFAAEPLRALLIPGIRMICSPPSPSVADRVKILTGPFPDDADLKAWATRMVAAADEFSARQAARSLGRLCFEIARFPRRVVRLGQVFVLGPIVPDLGGPHPLFG